MKRRVPSFCSARTGITGKRSSICTVGTASRAAPRMKACLKRGCAMLSVAHTKRVPSCAPGRAHLQEGEDRLAPADAAGDEDRHLGDVRQDLLRQHVEAHRADMPARLASPRSPARRRRPRTSRLASDQRRREAHHLGPALLGAPDGAARRDAAGEDDVPDLRREAGVAPAASSRGCMVIRFTPKGLSVSAWVPAISSASAVRLHRAAGDHAEGAGVGQRRDQVALAHPAHRPAHHGVRGCRGRRRRAPSAASSAARRRGGRSPVPIGSASIAAVVTPPARPGRRRCAARAPPARCSPPPTSTLTLISLVEMTWMLMPFSASARNMVLATPAWLRMPMPTTLIFATSGSASSAS